MLDFVFHLLAVLGQALLLRQLILQQFFHLLLMRNGKQVYSHLGQVRPTELDILLSNLSQQN